MTDVEPQPVDENGVLIPVPEDAVLGSGAPENPEALVASLSAPDEPEVEVEVEQGEPAVPSEPPTSEVPGYASLDG